MCKGAGDLFVRGACNELSRRNIDKGHNDDHYANNDESNGTDHDDYHDDNVNNRIDHSDDCDDDDNENSNTINHCDNCNITIIEHYSIEHHQHHGDHALFVFSGSDDDIDNED